ncbi:Hopene-associated glycosyltransferase HpnB [Olavius algarvensis associated proteobacterium Delta 3]|nr:Hopene-associated glycosyltransferase HpnB [Olavius algarvensis associated proteobacterium Delta 3]
MPWIIVMAVSGLIWLMLMIVPWRPWGTRETLDALSQADDTDLSQVTVLIPARNEASTIETALSSLMHQGKHLSVIVVDDRSTDGTARIAVQVPLPRLRVISGEPMPSGWVGKMWALEQGLRHVQTPLTLCIDADIQLLPGMIAALVEKMEVQRLHMVSAMACLKMVSFWERLLMPAFVYFFKMLYPFRLSNSSCRGVAAAAGGCVLIHTRVLRDIGGYASLRESLIDNCALARRLKSNGHRIWIGLTRSVRSLRSYERLAGIWNMVARTAFLQLRYSSLLLVVTTLVMGVTFWVPVVGLCLPGIGIRMAALGIVGAMMVSYLPVLRFYGRSPAWAMALPGISALFVAMTWTSAIRHWVGSGADWKGRSYGPDTS